MPCDCGLYTEPNLCTIPKCFSTCCRCSFLKCDPLSEQILVGILYLGTVAECVFLPSRWQYVVISAYCNPSHFFCDPSHLPVFTKGLVGADQDVCGTSLVRGPNKLPSSAFNHVCLVINYYLNTQRRVTRNSSTV